MGRASLAPAPEKKRCRILIVEHYEPDIELMQRELCLSGVDAEYRTAAREADFVATLLEFQPDIVLSDYQLPGFGGLRALEIASALTPQIPFIVVTGSVSEQVAVDCMKAGAVDYILKDRLARLPHAVHSALENRNLKALREISEHERLELEQKVHHLQKMDALGQLASGVAHDFNNLLSGILGQLSILRRRAGSDAAEPIDQIERACERASDLLRRLLTFSRNDEYVRSPFLLADVFREIGELCSATFDRRIRFEIGKVDPELVVMGSASRLHQTLLNLCVNARDALLKKLESEPQTPAGPSLLRVQANATEIDESYCETHPEARPGRFAVISVQDTGVGMSPQTLSRIFEPFFTTKPSGKGTGLGLSMVYGVARDHGGWVEVESMLGAGSVFKIYLPLTEERPAVPQQAASTVQPQGNERILVVDDDEFFGSVLVQLLEELGYRVQLAHDGREGLDIFSADPDSFDLVVCDLAMPGLSGLELVREIRTRCSEVKIICSSGHIPNRDRLREAGVQDFLVKPFRTYELAQHVRAALDGAEPPPAAL